MSKDDLSAPKLPVTAAVLAGGRSLRMGVDKTLLQVEGEPMVARVVAAVSEVCEHTVIVTNRPESLAQVAMPAEVGIFTDEVAYQGPLGGLSTALAIANDDWVLAVAADMPWLSGDVVRTLWAARNGHDVIIPMTPKGPEPLLALYRVEAVLPAAREVLATGRRRIVAMFPKLDVLELPIESLREIDPSLDSFFNVNTPADLAEVEARTDDEGQAVSPTEVAEPVTPPTEAPAEKPARAVKVLHASDLSTGMPSERPITIYLNDIEVATVQATSDYLEDMAVGFLVSEGLLRDRDAFTGVDSDAKRGIVYVNSTEEVPDDLVHKTRYVTSGCGKGITFSSVGHARGLSPVTTPLSIDPADLHGWVAEMARRSDEYREKGGSHACGLVIDGELVVVREDVGRHNAADKVLGHAWRDRLSVDRAIMLSTGRVSYEMTVKAAKSRIPMVASRSAATDLSAQIADELGITLVGYARGGKILVYTHPERIVEG